MIKDKYFILLDKTGDKNVIKINEVDDKIFHLLMEHLRTKYSIEECTVNEYKKFMRKLGK